MLNYWIAVNLFISLQWLALNFCINESFPACLKCRSHRSSSFQCKLAVLCMNTFSLYLALGNLTLNFFFNSATATAICRFLQNYVIISVASAAVMKFHVFLTPIWLMRCNTCARISDLFQPANFSLFTSNKETIQPPHLSKT